MRFASLALILPSAAWALPIELAHQGRALDAAGGALNGQVALEVRLYGSATDSDLLFDDDFAAVSVHDGYYDVVLGQDSSDLLDSAVFSTSTGVWVEVAVDGEVLGPREALVSVPSAAVATDVVGGTVTASSVTVTGSGEVVLGQTTETDCSTPGALVYDPVLSALKICTGEAYVTIGVKRIVDGASGRVWSDGTVASSCEQYRRPTESTALYVGATGDGAYVIDPDGVGGLVAFAAYCDMTTDGGGWTIVHSVTGADGQQMLVSNTEAGGNPLQFGHFNVSRAKKMAIAAISNETLFLRSDGRWLRANAPAFDGSLDTANRHPHTSVTVTARNGSTATAQMGYSNYHNAHGGDFAVTSGNIDHHTTSYYHLNSGCSPQYLYSYSSSSGDGDAGYDVNTTLGDWTQTHSCHGAEGGLMVFRTAMR